MSVGNVVALLAHVGRSELLPRWKSFEVDDELLADIDHENFKILGLTDQQARAAVAFMTGGCALAQQMLPLVSMPKVKLGRVAEFDVNSEKINAMDCGVSDADCVAFAARMKTGEISRVKTLLLVRFVFLLVNSRLSFHRCTSALT